MEKLKNILKKIKYYRVICILLALIFAITGLVESIVIKNGTEKYPDQTVAKRWDPNGKFSHISYFIKQSENFTPIDVERTCYELKSDIEAKLVSTSKENLSDVSTNMIVSYMGKSYITLENEGKYVSVDCYAVGGDFFFFHPVRLVNGTYFSSDDLMHDGIILDENTAWQLFGSNDIVGQQVYYGEKILFVKGVYDRPDDKIHRFAMGSAPEIFVPIELLNSDELPMAITCFELCLPNPIDNFAKNLMAEKNIVSEQGGEMIENSKRFEPDNLLAVLKEKKYRSLKDRDIIYPYWEKIARYEEEKLALPSLVRQVTLTLAAVIIIGLILYEITKHTKLKSRNDDNA